MGDMSDEDVMLRMFAEVYGAVAGSCYTDFDYDEDDKLIGISVMKDSNACWSKTKTDIVFDYIAKDFQ